MRPISALALALALAACEGTGGEPAPGTAGSGSTGSPIPTSSQSPLPSPTLEPSPSPVGVKLPVDAPRVVDDPEAIALITAGDLTPLAPPGAEIGFREVWTDPFEQVTFAWRRGDDPLAQEQGFVVWQRVDEAWVAVSAFTDRPDAGVLGISVQVGELTGDGIDEYLTFEQTGGSGACGRWRVISSTTGAAGEVFDRATCDTDIRIIGGALEMREAVYGPDDPHCCPSSFLTSTFEWDGGGFALVATEEQPAGG